MTTYSTFYAEVRDSISCVKKLYHESAEYLIDSMKWQKNEKILDYGCGRGEFAKKYLFSIVEEQNSKVYGVDIDEVGISAAKANNSHQDVEYFVGNILSKALPFPKLEMDKIISVFVLPYIEDTRSLFEPLFDLLQPGGQMGIIYPTGKFYKIAADVANLEKWREITQQTSLPWADWMSRDQSEIKEQHEILNSCGFVNTVDSKKEYTLKFETPDQLFEFLSVVHPGLNQIPWSSKSGNFNPQMKQELWQDLFHATKTAFPNVDMNQNPFVLDTVIVHRVVSEKSSSP